MWAGIVSARFGGSIIGCHMSRAVTFRRSVGLDSMYGNSYIESLPCTHNDVALIPSRFHKLYKSFSLSLSDPGLPPAGSTKPGKSRKFSTGRSKSGYGWKSGSGKSEVFQVMKPEAAALLRCLRSQPDVHGVWNTLDALPSGQASWQDLTYVIMEFRRLQGWLRVIQILEWVLQSKKFHVDVICYNYLIEAYGRIGQYWEAEKTFILLRGSFVIPSEMTYRMLMDAYNRAGLYAKAEMVFSEMKELKYTPELATYNILLNVLAEGGKFKRAEEIFSEMHKSCRPSAATYTSMINIYGRARVPDMAEKVFQRMLEANCPPTLFTMTALINSYAKEGLCKKAEQIFHELPALGIDPDVYTYNALMGAYSCAGYAAGASEVFKAMEDEGIEPDQVSYNILLDAYGRVGQSRAAEKVFQAMKDHGFTPTLRSNMLLLKGFVRSGHISKAENLVKDMERSGHKPDTFVYNSLLHGYGMRGEFDEVDRLLATMRKSPRSWPDISTYNVLININALAGFVEKAEEIFDSLGGEGLMANATTWTSLMGAHSRRKSFRKCLEVWNRMCTAGCFPDAATLRVLLASCRSKEELQEATAVYHRYQGEIPEMS